MVCPYKLTVTTLSAIASIFYIRTLEPKDEDEKNKGGGTIEKTNKTMVSSTRRMIMISLLVILHIDLIFTGYIRAGVKEGIAMALS